MKNMQKVLELIEANIEGKTVFHFMEEDRVVDVTGEEFFRDVRKTAAVIRELSLQGKHIGIDGINSYLWVVCVCAVFWTGSVAVLLDREDSPEILSRCVRKTDINAIFYDSETEKTVRTANLPASVVRLPMGVKTAHEPEGEEADLCTEKMPDSLACIFFTSGTTGESKAVMMSEKGLAAGICHRIVGHDYRRVLAVLPFHHIFGFSIVLNTLYLEAEVCIASEMKYFYRYMEHMKPDYVCVVPSMLRMLAGKLKNGGANGRDLNWDLHMINCGGASFCPEFLRMLLERNITVLQGYGASEAGPIGFLCEMTPDRPDTIGKPPEGMAVRIVDKEMYLKSDAVMMGYYGDKKGTEEVLCNGWYATGDLVSVDREGYYYLTGRRKNLIILSNGENISPEEIEKKLGQYKEIREVVVSAEGEWITAAVYPEYPAGCTQAEKMEVRSRIRAEIGEYNRSVPVFRQIRNVRFSAAPEKKTSIGKIVRPARMEDEKK